MWYRVSGSLTNIWKENRVAGDEAASPPKTPPESTSGRRSPLFPSLVCSPSPSCYLDELLPLCFLPVMFTQQLCEETTQGDVSPWAWVVRGLASPAFLPCSSQSCLVTRTSMKSLGHLGSPMPSWGCAFTAGFPLLGHFTFCLACWVSWHHLVCSSTSDRVKHSCIIPEKRLCHWFLPTPLHPAVPRYPRLITSGVWLFVGSERSWKCPTYGFLAAIGLLCFSSHPS